MLFSMKTVQCHSKGTKHIQDIKKAVSNKLVSISDHNAFSYMYSDVG